MLLAFLVGCDRAPDDGVATERLVRASMALRGVHPSVADMERVAADPESLESVARSWLADPRIGDTVRDMHAEELLVRTDAQPHPPAIGALAGYDLGHIASSLDEEPLRAIADVVTSGRPYTAVLTDTTAMADPIVSAAYGLPHDPTGTEWQSSWWTDGRPVAGVLSSTTLWQRHMSSDTNHHRARAKLIANVFLCDDIELRSDAGILEPALAEEAVDADPACTICHSVLDPLASAMSGMRRYVLPSETAQAIGLGCPDDFSWACFPIAMWDESLQEADAMLPPPALYGDSVGGLAELGEAIALDPRFPECTARRFFGYFARVAPAQVDDAVATDLAAAFVASGFDARELMLAAALHDGFAPGDGPDRIGALQARPEQLARTIEALTGYRWRGDPSMGGCDGSCWGAVDFATTDAFGLRTLMGGIDGWDVVDPEPRPLPTRELAIAWFAEEAAAFVVDHDAGAEVGARTLLADGVVSTPDAVRSQLAALHLAVLGEWVDGADLDATVGLWDGAFARSGDATHAWKVVVAAMLQDDRVVTY
jgi:hypothetical protein